MGSIFYGCGKSISDVSPVHSSDSALEEDNTGVATLTGIVGVIDSDSIKVDLVVLTDSTTFETIKIGSSTYAMLDETYSIHIDIKTTVILGYNGYIPGSLSDITEGDFLVIILRNDEIIALVDGGTENAGITQANTDTSSEKGVPDSNIETNYSVIVDNLKVRSGPGTTYSVLGILDTGSRVVGTVTNGWLEFTYDDKAAYCSAEYLSVSSMPDGVPDSNESKTYITTGNLVSRSGPGATYSSLGTLAKGTTVTGTISNGWLKFIYNDQTAYCSAAYLSAG
jgi:uncharacterized protein YraI